VTFGDLADPSVQAAVLNLIKAAVPETNPLKDHEWVSMLTSGALEAFWVLAEDGQPAGLITFQSGWMKEIEARGLYVVSACIAPHVSHHGWERLLSFGMQLARERQCEVIQFDTLPSNKRMRAMGAFFGAIESHARVVGGVTTVRFTVEVK